MSGELVGKATWFDAHGTLNCSFPPFTDWMVAAPKMTSELDLYNHASACGACLKVTGTNKANTKTTAIVVKVVDSCPDCKQSDILLDLSEEAFGRIDNLDTGIIDIRFQVVPCDVTGNLQYRFKDGSSQSWTAIQVLNHREPLATVEYSDNSGNWITTSRSDDNYFVPNTENGGVGPHSNGLPLRITDAYGQVVMDTVPVVVDKNAIDSSMVFPGTQQFE